MENRELISNEYHSLSELFSGEDKKIIIPDFQRDYCWGDKTHGGKNDSDIISGFLDTLIEEFNSNKESDLLLGKIDVYESPKNHIYLTDGQQRLTSLYLIMGMLYRLKQIDELKKCLISDFEENQDDKEPYLQYAVRESTVFFLRDLVNDFFINGNALKVEDIKNQSWYFREYDLDPSIISMLASLKVIENKLSNINFVELTEFVINKIKIQYYDVQDKKHGEERFVIINTTGKSLTASENIKPILLANSTNEEFAKQWEERETWFWKNRNVNEWIADNGVNEFLTWCFQIIEKQERIDIIKKAKELLKNKKNEDYLKFIHQYFNSLTILVNFLNDDKLQKQFQFINDNNEVKGILGLRERGLSVEKQQNILLPLLAFITKFGDNQEKAYQFLRRLRKNYFDLKWKDRNENYLDWRDILQIIENAIAVEDVFQFDNYESLQKIQNITLNELWYNEEEKFKNNLKQSHKEIIEEWEDYSDFMGDLSPLLNVTEKTDDFKTLKEYFEVYKQINPNNFTFPCNVKLSNLYCLLSYMKNGRFEHRSVSWWGYCMLIQSNERPFAFNYFNDTWKLFMKKNDNDIYNELNEELKKFFQDKVLILNSSSVDLNSLIEDTRKIGHYQRVYLWAILEYLNTEEKLIFDKNISQFWEYPNLSIINEKNNTSEKNDYSIGNFLLGTSYYNNKSGWINFSSYPLMKSVIENKIDIKKQTECYKSLINIIS